jgi:type IV pilus assembly protein PilP
MRLVMPELLRTRDVLENVPRERLQYVGHMAYGSESEALVKVLPPAGAKKDTQMMSVYRVRLGQRVGQDFGKVLTVQSDHLLLQELVLTPAGEWQTREVRLPLQEAVP